MRLIITRPRDNAAILKEKLKELGNYSIELILISIEPRAKAAIPSEAYQALALTSANAMLSPALAPAPAALREVPVFAVGAQSAAAARRAGYTTVVGEGGDVAGLGEAVTRHCDPKNGPVLYPSGSETAGDLKATLEGRGFRVDRVISMTRCRQKHSRQRRLRRSSKAPPTACCSTRREPRASGPSY